MIARRIAPNRRLLVASPAYLAERGVPRVPNDLSRHNCIGIRQGEGAYGVWRLATGRGRNAVSTSVKTRGNLATNDGEIALVQVLPQYQTPDASIHAVYPQRHQSAARVRAFVDFVAAAFEKDAPGKAWSRDARRQRPLKDKGAKEGR